MRSEKQFTRDARPWQTSPLCHITVKVPRAQQNWQASSKKLGKRGGTPILKAICGTCTRAEMHAIWILQPTDNTYAKRIWKIVGKSVTQRAAQVRRTQNREARQPREASLKRTNVSSSITVEPSAETVLPIYFWPVHFLANPFGMVSQSVRVEGWGPRNFALFLPSPAPFSLFLSISGVFSWNLCGVRGPSNVHARLEFSVVV